MVWQVVACVLAAAGLMRFLWGLAGAVLLPVAGDNLTMVCRAKGDAPELEQTVRSFAWLRGTGMVELPLQILDCGMTPQARRRAERLARQHPYVQLIAQGATDEQEDAAVGRPGDDSRQCDGGGLSE